MPDNTYLFVAVTVDIITENVSEIKRDLNKLNTNFIVTFSYYHKNPIYSPDYCIIRAIIGH